MPRPKKKNNVGGFESEYESDEAILEAFAEEVIGNNINFCWKWARADGSATTIVRAVTQRVWDTHLLALATAGHRWPSNYILALNGRTPSPLLHDIYGNPELMKRCKKIDVAELEALRAQGEATCERNDPNHREYVYKNMRYYCGERGVWDVYRIEQEFFSLREQAEQASTVANRSRGLWKKINTAIATTIAAGAQSRYRRKRVAAALMQQAGACKPSESRCIANFRAAADQVLARTRISLL